MSHNINWQSHFERNSCDFLCFPLTLLSSVAPAVKVGITKLERKDKLLPVQFTARH